MTGSGDAQAICITYDPIPNIVALTISHFEGKHKIHNAIRDISSNILKCNFSLIAKTWL